MLFKITLLTSLIFSVVYPVCFLLHFKSPLKNNFHHFHLGLPCIIASLSSILLLTYDLPSSLKLIISIWSGLFLMITFVSWRKESPSVFLISLLTLCGLMCFYKIHNFYLTVNFFSFLTWVLGGGIFCASLYAMNLGHWYLNVHGLPIKHLRQATYALWLLVGIRLVYNIIAILSTQVFLNGTKLTLLAFISSLEGFLLSIAILFGTLFPGIGLFFAKGTLDLKNTQATTGILYVILCAVLLGDMTYKYFAIKYNIWL